MFCTKYRSNHPVNTFAFLANGRSYIVGGPQGQLTIWNAATGQPLFEIANIGAAVYAIQPLENGFLASTRRVKDNGRTEVVWYEF